MKCYRDDFGLKVVTGGFVLSPALTVSPTPKPEEPMAAGNRGLHDIKETTVGCGGEQPLQAIPIRQCAIFIDFEGQRSARERILNERKTTIERAFGRAARHRVNGGVRL